MAKPEVSIKFRCCEIKSNNLSLSLSSPEIVVLASALYLMFAAFAIKVQAK